jgi:hypothetical protein
LVVEKPAEPSKVILGKRESAETAQHAPSHPRPSDIPAKGSLSNEGERRHRQQSQRSYRTVESVEPLSGRKAKFATRDTRMAFREGRLTLPLLSP